MKKQGITFIVVLLFARILPAQTCTSTGQTPSSAILLCGAESYVLNTVPLCGQTNIPVPCPATVPYQNTNPTWFRMDCFSSGTLGFVITPNDPADNYDWQLFDISGRNDDDVFTYPSLFLACNWCSDPGETGASSNGSNLAVCAGATQELFSKMPDIIQGHEYLLMVSHRNDTESGFQIVLTGGSASVTDPLEPRIFNAKMSCNSTQINVLLNKKMFCSTVSPDGSEFLLSSGATILSATAAYCMDDESNQVTLTLSNSVTPGNYTLSIRDGTDGNTIRDRCNRFIPSGDNVPVIFPSLQPATMDSLTDPGCSPASLHLVFEKALQCSSIAADASDFSITGAQPVSITHVITGCNAQTASTFFIDLVLSSPITTAGNYQISLVAGSDGNTLLDECGIPVPAGTLPFTLKAPVSALFNYRIHASCKEDTIYFSPINSNGIIAWNWNFDNTLSANSPDQVKIYPASGQHDAQLIVSNGSCTDTARQTITLDNRVVVAFDVPAIICPEDPVRFINNSTGTVDQWVWNFGNGLTSGLQTPSLFHYPVLGKDFFYTIKLVGSNNTMNCKDSVTRTVEVLSNCTIAVPTAFTPNGDGLNDYLQPNNAIKADNLLFSVYNRFGQLVFETRDWTRKWDGRINGILQPTGVYAWVLSYVHRDTKEKVFKKGTTLLIR
ncbi:MAG: gliding motility-associated C-terminal domain-containing protein [Bacteroidota bacterium]|nr:gliding motility-associated C-terminal domain-containing protein [Bacteroidota bacterium]